MTDCALIRLAQHMCSMHVCLVWLITDFNKNLDIILEAFTYWIPRKVQSSIEEFDLLFDFWVRFYLYPTREWFCLLITHLIQYQLKRSIFYFFSFKIEIARNYQLVDQILQVFVVLFSFDRKSCDMFWWMDVWEQITFKLFPLYFELFIFHM